MIIERNTHGTLRPQRAFFIFNYKTEQRTFFSFVIETAQDPFGDETSCIQNKCTTCVMFNNHSPSTIKLHKLSSIH